MQIPLSLIKSFLKLDLPPAKIGEVLTLLGLEVDRIHNEEPPFAKVVVGEVLAVKRHPDAEKLQVAQVSDGAKTFTVVCGAPNCRSGMKTAFAQVGAVLTDGDGHQRHIEKTSIRGVESFGMLCSNSELRISDDHAGILDLPHEMKTGADIAALLWDPVFEISLTPNLGHCMSALGIARELSASLQVPLHKEKIAPLPNTKLAKEVIVADGHLCHRYLCRLIEGVKVGPSPFWLKKTLEACGQKSINNVVDVVNFVMMKLGQPMHAFDYDLLEGKTLEVGPAKRAQKFLGLDGVEREVPAGALLISDGHKAVAIAGIMGSSSSAVSEKTMRILLEAASFDPISVRSTSRKIGLRTESSQRFEKGVDPTALQDAIAEACHWIGGTVQGGADIVKGSLTPKEIKYRPERVNHLLGMKLSVTEMGEIFQRLGFKVNGNQVTVPLYRNDVSEEIDLIEEIARIYGYNNIEKSIPRCATSQIPNDPVYLFENELRCRLAGLGLMEFLTCDLISPKLAEIAKAVTPTSMGFLQATYSKSEDFSILRTSLLPGLLNVTKHNLDQKNLSISAFEIGRIHFLQNGKPVEIPMGAILLTGKATLPHWSHKTADVDYFDLKGIVESMVKASFLPSHHMSFHPGRQADIHVGDAIVGSLGEVHPHLLEKCGIEQRVYYAEFQLPHLMRLKKSHLTYVPLPQFPASERDWTLPLDLHTPIDPIFQAIYGAGSPLLERVELIDLYLPESTPQKNATFRFTYRDKFKTISFNEVESEHAKMMDTTLKFLAK
ncbi:MAG TPA: phenylalanine--tRNA ligase subunit beta [Chlamydiales bacterium]|nr:phenylalanine--tRNA ligase subunit beta [Chlamydiales bacterium]